MTIPLPAVDITQNWCVHTDNKKYLFRYYLLYWDYEYYISQLQKSLGGQDIIIHDGVTYVVTFLEYSTKANPRRVALSFRSTHPELFGYVLIKAVS